MSLLRLDEILPVLKSAPYFTKQNLGLALGKEGEALNYWVEKLLREKALVTVKKGVYISSYYQDLVSQNPEASETYFEYLANTLRYPSYVSLEYMLAKYGFMPESPFALTSVTIKSSRIFKSQAGTFIYKNVKPELFFGWKTGKFNDKEIKAAALPKALFDFLYLKKLIPDWQDYLADYGRFNWEVLTKEDIKEFEELVEKTKVRKMELIYKFLIKEKII